MQHPIKKFRFEVSGHAVEAAKSFIIGKISESFGRSCLQGDGNGRLFQFNIAASPEQVKNVLKQIDISYARQEESAYVIGIKSDSSIPGSSRSSGERRKIYGRALHWSPR